VDLDAPQGARIQIDVDNGNVWLSANRSGWLHLARICAEMGLQTGFNPGYHFHRSLPDWGPMRATHEQEVSFELLDDEESE
jgi:hypothetical protein